MSASGFAIFCLVGFLLPVPLLVWLDRPRRTGTRGTAGGPTDSASAPAAPNDPSRH